MVAQALKRNSKQVKKKYKTSKKKEDNYQSNIDSEIPIQQPNQSQIKAINSHSMTDYSPFQIFDNHSEFSSMKEQQSCQGMVRSSALNFKTNNLTEYSSSTFYLKPKKKLYQKNIFSQSKSVLEGSECAENGKMKSDVRTSKRSYRRTFTYKHTNQYEVDVAQLDFNQILQPIKDNFVENGQRNNDIDWKK